MASEAGRVVVSCENLTGCPATVVVNRAAEAEAIEAWNRRAPVNLDDLSKSQRRRLVEVVESKTPEERLASALRTPKEPEHVGFVPGKSTCPACDALDAVKVNVKTGAHFDDCTCSRCMELRA